MLLVQACLSWLLFFREGSGVTGSVADDAEAIQLYAHGQFRQAAEILAQKCRAAPQDSDLHFWLGKCYLKTQKVDEAVREFEKALQIRPSNSAYHLWLGRAYGQKASHAFLLSALGWARKLRKEFETAVDLSPDDMDVRFDLLEFYIEAPGIVGGGKDKAEAQVREIARRNPRLGYTARARLYEKEKKWDLARKELTQSTREYPKVADSYLDLADFLRRRGDFRGSESAAREALRLGKVSPRARLYIAVARIELLRELSDAEKGLIEILQGPLRDEDPSFAEVHYWLGQAYLQQGREDEARREFESSLQFDPEHNRAKDALSRVRKGA